LKSRWSYFALSLVTVFSIVNCGGKTKLTDEQKAQFKTVIASTGRAASGTMSARTTGAAAVSSLMSATGATSDADAEKIANYIRGKKCEFTMSEPKAGDTSSSSNPLGISNFKFTAGGADCPVTANFSFEVSMAGDMKTSADMKMSWDFSFEVKDAELKKLNDVSKFAIKGSIGLVASSGSAKLTGSTSGSISSAQYGEIQLSGDISGSGDNGGGNAEGKFVTKFPSHEVEVKFETDGKSQNFFLNGEPQTKEQLQELFKTGIPGAPATEQSSLLPGDGVALTGFTNLLNLIQ